MLRMTLAGLLARRHRLVATALATVLGVALVSGTLIFTATARAALYDECARSGRNVDVSVERQPAGQQPADAALTQGRLDTVRALPGVAAAEGRMRSMLPLLDRQHRLVTSHGGNAGLGVSTGAATDLREYDMVDGRAPTGRGEAALDRDTAGQYGFAVGDTIAVLDADQQPHQLHLVGVVTFRTAMSYAGLSVVVLPQEDLTLLTGEQAYVQFVLQAKPGVPAPRLAGDVRAALGTQVQVRTGDALRRDLANAAIGRVDSFLIGLQLFAWIAMLVAAFVIYNTFAVLVAQRVREHALLRCVGATRRQLLRSVLIEAAVVGLCGGVFGVSVGVGVAAGLFRGIGLVHGRALFGDALVGAQLPMRAPVVTATPVVVAVVVGVLVTLAAAFLPALRATRTAPLSALRHEPTIGGGRLRRWGLPPVVVLLGVAGTWMTVRGLTYHPSTAEVSSADTEYAAGMVVGGGVVNFLAVLLAAPWFVGRLVWAAGALAGLVVGVPARLAAANGRADPGRTAVTTAALMVGVGLMAAGSVLTASTKASATAELGENYSCDYVLAARPVQYVPGDDDPLAGDAAGSEQDPQLAVGVAERLRAGHTFAGVARVRTAQLRIDKVELPTGAVDEAGRRLVTPAVASGSLSKLRSGTIALDARWAKRLDKGIGDHVVVGPGREDPTGQDPGQEGPGPGGPGQGGPAQGPGRQGPVAGRPAAGAERVLTIVALLKPADQPLAGLAMVSWEDFAAAHPTTGDSLVLVRRADGMTPRLARKQLTGLLADQPLVGITSLAEQRSDVTAAVDTILALVAALLGFAVLIALVGIVNTLSLSVLERTRESAVVRALGLTKGQLRAALLIEALLMAVVGAAVGVVFGVGYGLGVTTVMLSGDTTVILQVPVGWLLASVATAGLAGAVASLLPARRAARASIVAGMAEA